MEQERENTCPGPAAPNTPYHPRRPYYFNVKHSTLQTSKVTFRLASPLVVRSQARALISFPYCEVSQPLESAGQLYLLGYLPWNQAIKSPFKSTMRFPNPILLGLLWLTIDKALANGNANFLPVKDRECFLKTLAGGAERTLAILHIRGRSSLLWICGIKMFI